MQSMAQQQSAAVWTARYSPPQYGRKRNPDLMVTGMSALAQLQCCTHVLEAQGFHWLPLILCPQGQRCAAAAVKGGGPSPAA